MANSQSKRILWIDNKGPSFGQALAPPLPGSRTRCNGACNIPYTRPPIESAVTKIISLEMAAPKSAVPQTINLRPDLALIVSQLHASSAGRLAKKSLSAQDLDAQAVATAVTISKGSNFIVLKKKTAPKYLPKWQPTPQLGNATILAGGQFLSSEVPPREILYKVPHVELDDQGHAVPEKRAQLAGLLIETLVLLHEPIDRHPYFPRLWGVTWTYNSFSPADRIPVLVMLPADHGSLADFQTMRSEPLRVEEKRKICWQIGIAVDFLHECGIKHGDIKSENVLIYNHPDGGILAKLSDFGFASISEAGSFNFLPPGSALWGSPELRWAQGKAIDLKKSDVYSYGLMVWRIFNDGNDPLTGAALLGDQAPQASDRPDDATMRVLMENNTIMTRAEGLTAIDHLNKLEIESSDTLDWLVLTFHSTLAFDPQKRHLVEAISQLNYDKAFSLPKEYPKPTSLQEMVNSRFRSAANNSTSMSWIAMRNLDAFTRDAIMRHRLARQAQEDVTTTTEPGMFLGIAACQLSGMGADSYFKPDEALDAIVVACRKNNRSAAAIVFRAHEAFQRDIPRDIDYVNKIKEAAIYGSDAAYEDLKIVAAELCQQVKFSKHHQTCGVGANFFWDTCCLNGWSFADHKANMSWILPYLETSGPEPWKTKVNQRGDTFLHAAVSLSIEGLLPILVGKYKFPIDLENNVGETPLLCAMRNGRADFVDQLLDLGADPKHVSQRGEAPMHWIISFADIGVQSITNKLMQHGAAPTLSAWAERCDYAAAGLPTYVQYAEKLSAGTPIHWAICRKKPYHVRALMDHGAKVNDYGPAVVYYTALEQAAYLQEADLLRLMIERHFPPPRKHHASHIGNRAAITRVLEGEKDHSVLHGLREMIKAAIDGSDRYSLLIRHGDRYKAFMRRTFSLLGEETKISSFPEGIDQEAHSILHYAALRGFEEAVVLIMTYMNGAADINVRHGYMGDTPVCEAIRRNHKSMFYFLISKGADVMIPVDAPDLQGLFYWGLLHISAQFVVSDDLEIAKHLMERGIKLDGYGTPADPAESPLAIAIDNNQLAFSTLVRKARADMNATSRYVLQGRYKLMYQTTILGRSIIANMRHSHYKLGYLLYPTAELQQLSQPNFVVVPELGLTALHASLLAEELLEEAFERDEETSNDIFSFLCEKYDSPEEINQPTGKTRETALHIAVRKGNLHAVQTLVNDYDASADIPDAKGLTASDLAAIKLSALISQEMADESAVEQMVQIVELVGPSESSTDDLETTELLERLEISPKRNAVNQSWIGLTGNEVLTVKFDLTNVRLMLTELRGPRTTSLRIDVTSPLPFTLQQVPPFCLTGVSFICQTVFGLAVLLIASETALSSLGEQRAELMWSIVQTIEKKVDPPPQTNSRNYWTVTNTSPRSPTFNMTQFVTMMMNFLQLARQSLIATHGAGSQGVTGVGVLEQGAAIDLRTPPEANNAAGPLQLPNGMTQIGAPIDFKNRWLVGLKSSQAPGLFGGENLLWFSFPFEPRDPGPSVDVDKSATA